MQTLPKKIQRYQINLSVLYLNNQYSKQQLLNAKDVTSAETVR